MMSCDRRISGNELGIKLQEALGIDQDWSVCSITIDASANLPATVVLVCNMTEEQVDKVLLEMRKYALVEKEPC
jgi:hypothetical protein